MEAVSDERLLSILREYWGYGGFRGIQLDIIRSILSGRDTLGLMPTGGGKSLTFQVPAMALEGTCIVVTPLIALMKDQVQALRRRGIPACAVYSGQSREEMLRHLDNCILGGYKLLYVSPERLSSTTFLKKLGHMHVSFLAVDEAHCISQWGHDFRPAYLQIPQLRNLLPHAPVLALTATATPRVVEDIMCNLQVSQEGARKDFALCKMSFERKNLSYVVRRTDDKYGELLHILRSVPGSAIVYTRSRVGSRDLARDLEADGETALYYHAGLPHSEKDERQRLWQEGKARIMVATNAFGMGIDKADVRLVVHMDLPDSLEAYFQEAGRAGRDGRRAYAVLLYASMDGTTMRRRIPSTFPDKAYIREVYDNLGNFFQLAYGFGHGRRFEFDLEKFCRSFRYFPVPVVSSLNILTRAGYILFEEEAENNSRLTFTVRRDELYRLQMVSEEEEAVIRALLRNYGGLFSDFVTIDEKLLADTAGQSEEAVYNSLVALSREGIVSYVPRKKIPAITYTRDREMGEDLVIDRLVYENRLEDYKQRIQAILDYATTDDICRSAFMLHYFGEEGKNCGTCDVCIGHREHAGGKLHQMILNTLSDGEYHDVDELHYAGIPTEQVAAALRRLVDSGKVRMADGRFQIMKVKKDKNQLQGVKTGDKMDNT